MELNNQTLNYLLLIKEWIIKTHVDAGFVALNVVQRTDHSQRSHQVDVIILDLLFRMGFRVAQSKTKKKWEGKKFRVTWDSKTRDTIALLFHTFVLMMSLVVVVVLE